MGKLPKVIVIVGPTASGKTSLSIAIAKRFEGEVVSADSRQVYRGLDLGTGKVTHEEMDGVPHHMLDVADPMDTYTASDFIRDGRKAIADILERGHLPIIAGGSFFYIDALLGKIATPEVPPNPELRAKLETISTDALYSALLKSDERRAADIDPNNQRRLVRALEVVAALGKVPQQKQEIIYNTLTIGIDFPKKELHEHIHTRILERITRGMIDEVRDLHANGVTYGRMEELGLEYKYCALFLQEKLTKEEMIAELDTKTRQFAKRQLTWLKRDKSINWFKLQDQEKIFSAVSEFLKLEK